MREKDRRKLTKTPLARGFSNGGAADFDGAGTLGRPPNFPCKTGKKQGILPIFS